MKTVAQYDAQLDRYHRLNNEIELLQSRLTGKPAPVDYGTWEMWKRERGYPLSSDAIRTPSYAELFDDPDFQRLLHLSDELADVWCDLLGDVDTSVAHHKLVEKMIWSFPSLRKWMRHPGDMPVFHHILSRKEEDDPQAYYAARFVYLFDSEGGSAEWPDYRFYLDKAFAVWDEAHKQAFVHWVNMPFFPTLGVRTVLCVSLFLRSFASNPERSEYQCHSWFLGDRVKLPCCGVATSPAFSARRSRTTDATP